MTATGGRALVTGGAGFVGSNLAHRLLADGCEVTLLDDLSRPGVARNAAWLAQAHGGRVTLVQADIADADAVRRALHGVDQVFHLAAQVAVTTSLDDPLRDFTVNAAGTLTLLEAMRAMPTPPRLVFASTNKVYGGLEDLGLGLVDGRYAPVDPVVRGRGIGEERPLSFRSPYGCSKGAADQYVLDYAQTFGLPACVFRMSCIYGPRQLGTEDQGWVAHFVAQARRGMPLTIYGDGRQVRDVLFVDDLVDAFLIARDNLDRLRGRAFNLGGGVARTLSLLELVDRIARLHGRRPPVHHADWRPGDQRWYVSDTSAFERATGWQARTSVDDGLARLDAWLAELAIEPVQARPEAPAVGGGT